VVVIVERLFDLPMHWAVEFTKSNLKKEVDFVNEVLSFLFPAHPELGPKL
jgi:hypothetical protein